MNDLRLRCGVKKGVSGLDDFLGTGAEELVGHRVCIVQGDRVEDVGHSGIFRLAGLHQLGQDARGVRGQPGGERRITHACSFL